MWLALRLQSSMRMISTPESNQALQAKRLCDTDCHRGSGEQRGLIRGISRCPKKMNRQ
jgi:hypothetical protein